MRFKNERGPNSVWEKEAREMEVGSGNLALNGSGGELGGLKHQQQAMRLVV